MNSETLAKLRAPFQGDAIGKLPKVNCGDCSAKDRQCNKHQRKTCRVCKAYISTQHIHLDYVGHAHVTERLLDVDPDWSWEPLSYSSNGLPFLDDGYGLWIKLTIGGKTMIGFGDAPGKRGGNAVKEAIGDAIRNAAMRFGVALDLWKKEAPEAAPEQREEKPAAPLTPEQRATELRKAIATVGKRASKSVDQVAADFYEWSHGKEIGQASPAVLAEYLEHIQRPA
ncbi:hypothetical protein [Amycolatopsis sp. NPDC001319]|uniref:hypothetical protein n=1 Tax=unclassified Amycolatopsis TaxID=2618356 RepID=UPI00368043DF